MLLSEATLRENSLVAAANYAANYAAKLGKGIPAIFCSDSLYNKFLLIF